MSFVHVLLQSHSAGVIGVVLVAVSSSLRCDCCSCCCVVVADDVIVVVIGVVVTLMQSLLRREGRLMTVDC